MIDTSKIWGYDFEVYSKINWFCVTFINYESFVNDPKNYRKVVIVNNKEEFTKFYNDYKDNIFVSYNGRQYDTGIFKGILDGLEVGKVNDDIIIHDKKPARAVKNFRKYQLYDYDAIIKDNSLKQLEAFMGDDIRETEVSFDIERDLTEDEVQKTLFYNEHDVVELLKVLQYKMSDFEGQFDIIDLYNRDMSDISKTKVQLATSILNAVEQHTMDDEFDIEMPETIDIPQKYQYIVDWYLNPKNWRYKEHLYSESDNHPNQLIVMVAGIPHIFSWGGCHGADEKESIFEGIILHADISAMYPSIDINYNKLSRKYINPEDFRRMRDFRLELKAKKDSKNVALKPLINGVYGAMKDRNNPSYDPRNANLTCIFGQMIILDVISHIEDYCRLLQTNTDGIFVLCENEEMKNKVIEIINETGKRLRMEFEIDEFTKLIQKDVNNYIAIPKSGKPECKGAMVKYNSPIDNDLPILNEALREYFINNIPVEETINNCNELIKFQKIIKLSSKYKEVWIGREVKVKDKVKNKIKVTHINGELLQGKVHRLFASSDENDGGIYKLKIENKEKCYEKFANTPDNLFIINSDIHNIPIPKQLNRQYYIDEAKKRIEMFVTKTETKKDDTPEILFECMKQGKTFYDFLKLVKENKIQKKTLADYITANCCKYYGKTYKLLTFFDYFNEFYDKKKITKSNLEKKYNNEIQKLIKDNSEVSATGKTFNLNYESLLKKIFNNLENKDIVSTEIITAQLKLFNNISYTDSESKDIYFVLNTRNQISPNIIVYNLSKGTFEYKKVDKNIFSILPMFDGDLIKVISSETVYGKIITGKTERGVNITEDDKSKEYECIRQYKIISRNYNKAKTLIEDYEE